MSYVSQYERVCSIIHLLFVVLLSLLFHPVWPDAPGDVSPPTLITSEVSQ